MDTSTSSGRSTPPYEARWRGQTVIILAGGPSLSESDIEAARQAQERGFRILAINTTWKRIVTADALYACDYTWWQFHYAEVAERFKGALLTVDKKAGEMWPIERWESTPKPGLSLTPGIVHEGQNGGYQAINFAVLFGARRILLLGYDMQHGPKGEIHHHGKHPNGMNNPGDEQLAGWAAFYQTMLPDLETAGVEVVNCTRRTRLTCFPRSTIDCETSKV